MFRFEERAQEGVDKNTPITSTAASSICSCCSMPMSLAPPFMRGSRSAEWISPPNCRSEIQYGPKEMGVSVRMVADASGRHTLLKPIEVKIKDTASISTQSIHGLGASIAGRRKVEYGTRFHPHSLSANLEQLDLEIPITDEITSLGVVTQKANFASSKQEREDFFWKSVESRPASPKPFESPSVFGSSRRRVITVTR